MIDASRYNAPRKYKLRSLIIVAILGPAAIAGIYFATLWLMEELPPPPPQESHSSPPPNSAL